MEGWFGRMCRDLAGSRSRRDVLGASALTLAAGFGAAFGLSPDRPAQASVPDVGGKTPPSEPQRDTYYMFVQAATSGTLVPDPSVPNTYTLSLNGVDGETVYFSDRPVRDAGRVNVQPFLDALAFTPVNPPNAALVVSTPSGDDTLVLELFNPNYDAGAATLSYAAHILTNYTGSGLAPFADKSTNAIPASFEEASLFIDDCPNGNYRCAQGEILAGGMPGSFGCCWHWSNVSCNPCGPVNNTANQQYCNANYPGSTSYANCPP
jgi:hypothetical protein